MNMCALSRPCSCNYSLSTSVKCAFKKELGLASTVYAGPLEFCDFVDKNEHPDPCSHFHSPGPPRLPTLSLLVKALLGTPLACRDS